MDKSLEDLIAGATARLHAVESQSERDSAERAEHSAVRQAAAFRHLLQEVLGRSVIACLQPVIYENDRMCFSIDGKGFELRQAAGMAIDLLEGNRELFHFDLASPMARDHFLRALGAAVSKQE